MNKMHKPLHPGEIVKSVLIDSTGMSVTIAAKRLAISRTALSSLINCHVKISPEMALRLSKLLNTSVDMWINLQAQYDTWLIKQQPIKLNIKPLNKKVA